VNPVLVRALREALAALGGSDRGLRARLEARLASALQPASDPGEPIALALGAIDLARGEDDAALLATLYSACSALGDLAPPGRRAPLNQECAELAARLGDPAVAQRARARLAIDLVELGALDRADAAIAEAERLGEDLGLPHYRWRPILLRSMRALMHGRLAESDRLVEQAGRLVADLDEFDARVALLIHRLGAAATAGRFGALQPLLEELGALTTSLEYGRLLGGVLSLGFLAAAGEVEAVRRHPLAGSGVDQALAGVARHDLQLLSSISQVVAAAGSPEMAEAVCRMAEPLADREPTTGMMGLVYIGPFRGSLAALAAAAGRREEALRSFEGALRRCRDLRLLPLEAHLRAERAAFLDALGRSAEARAERETSQALARELGMAATSRVLETRKALGLPFGAAGPRAAPAPAPAPDFALEREGELWAVRHGETTFRLRHSRGLEMLAALLAEPGRELHCTELDLPGGDARGAGDAGEVLDARARQAYRERSRELEAELRQAEDFHDAGRAERARAELEALADELARGVGLGGRGRRRGSLVERSRVNVQRRLKDAVGRIGEQDPALGRHLEAALRTGTFCSYSP
jgi:hypothetical protein